MRVDNERKGTHYICNGGEDMTKLRVSLITGRTIDQGRAKEYSKLSKAYWESATSCEIDPEDMKYLGVSEKDTVKLTTEFGSVVVRAVESIRGPHSKIVFLPYGPWVNLVVNPRTDGTGMPSLKGVEAEIEPAPQEDVLSLQDLLKKHYTKT